MDITFVTELNTVGYGIKKFEIDGESMYLLHSTKTGVLMRGKWYRKWEAEGRKWYPADRVWRGLVRSLVDVVFMRLCRELDRSGIVCIYNI